MREKNTKKKLHRDAFEDKNKECEKEKKMANNKKKMKVNELAVEHVNTILPSTMSKS